MGLLVSMEGLLPEGVALWLVAAKKPAVHRRGAENVAISSSFRQRTKAPDGSITRGNDVEEHPTTGRDAGDRIAYCIAGYDVWIFVG